MDFFPLRSNKSPKIYAYTEPYPEYAGLIKVGYTEREVSTRMQEHYPTAGPDASEDMKFCLKKAVCVKMEHFLRIMKFIAF